MSLSDRHLFKVKIRHQNEYITMSFGLTSSPSSLISPSSDFFLFRFRSLELASPVDISSPSCSNLPSYVGLDNMAQGEKWVAVGNSGTTCMYDSYGMSHKYTNKTNSLSSLFINFSRSFSLAACLTSLASFHLQFEFEIFRIFKRILKNFIR